jgi:hypothetical protein
MRKLNNIEMSLTVGGIKCGWVGIAAVLSIATFGVGSLFGLNDQIYRCWNS